MIVERSGISARMPVAVEILLRGPLMGPTPAESCSERMGDFFLTLNPDCGTVAPEKTGLVMLSQRVYGHVVGPLPATSADIGWIQVYPAEAYFVPVVLYR
jgi:hypothetical protein